MREFGDEWRHEERQSEETERDNEPTITKKKNEQKRKLNLIKFRF